MPLQTSRFVPPATGALPSLRPRRRGVRTTARLAAAFAVGLLLVGLASTTTLGATTYAAKCDDVNLRKGPGTSYAIKAQVDRGARLTVVKKVSGGSYGTSCRGRWRSGTAWYRISAIDGVSVASRYGVKYIYGASKLFRSVATLAGDATPAAPTPSPTPSPTPTPTPTPAATPAPATTTMGAICDAVNLRKGPGTTYAIKTSVAEDTLVSVVATVSGGSWSTACKGKSIAGSSWLRISAIDGQPVSSLLGVSYVYGAAGLFHDVPTAEPDSDPTPSPDSSLPPLPEGVTALPDSVTFYGRGWGHGVGLSQYGAYGRALDGQTAGQILSHYYEGTTAGSIGNPTVRVLVLSGFEASASSPVSVFGRDGSWSIDGIEQTFPGDSRLRMIPTTTDGATSWQAIVDDVDGATLYDAPVPRKLTVRPGNGASLQLWSKPSAYDRYRGTLRIIGSDGASATVKVVNRLTMESYLRGVVPAEVSAAWPAEAIKAQAIAARSYAARRLHPGKGAFDLYDDTRHQVYRGLLAEKGGTNDAIAATAGKVRLAPNGSVANTLFHSTGGGATENNENVFVSNSGELVAGPVKYLRGSLDRRPDGTSYDDASNLATWKTDTYSLAQLQTWFAADPQTDVGTMVGLDLRDRGVSGRLISVTLFGADGTTKKVSGAVFIAVFNAERPSGDRQLRSTLFDLAPIL